jgi:hypothetical protein
MMMIPRPVGKMVKMLFLAALLLGDERALTSPMLNEKFASVDIMLYVGFYVIIIELYIKRALDALVHCIIVLVALTASWMASRQN